MAADERPSLDSVFCAAIELASAEERERYIARACRDDAELKERVERLVDAHFAAGCFLESPATAAAAAVGKLLTVRAGTVIGPYTLLEQIGEGGFGMVFLAEQTQPLRRKVALKVLRPGVDTRQVIARFEAERQALALMDHPNIAKVFDAGATGIKDEAGSLKDEKECSNLPGSSFLVLPSCFSGRPYFVMELVRGVPITQFCDENRLSVRERLELFVPVCQAVQHAHQKGVIHRDLKPSNVLVDLRDGTAVPKIIDFGIAKAVGQEQRLTEKTLVTGFAQFLGTPMYMSPEQAGLDGLDVDTRSDLYSLGVLLYELLTSTTPFEKERLRQANFDAVLRIIREEETPWPSARVSTVLHVDATVARQRQLDPARLKRMLRGELDWILVKALEKDRTRRYATAQELVADLRRYLDDEPTLARPPTLRRRAAKWARRHRSTATAAAIFLVLGVLGLAVSVLLLAREQAKTARARDQALDRERALRQVLYAQDMSLAQRAFHDGDSEQLRALLERHRPAAGQNDPRGFEWYYLLRRYKDRPRLAAAVKAHDGEAYCVVYAPDGQSVASGGQDGAIRIWDTEMLRPLLEWPSGQKEVNEVVFTPDGQTMASAGDDGTVCLWDARTGRRRAVLDPRAAGPGGLPTGKLPGEMSALALAPDGKTLAAGGATGWVWLWDVSTGARKAGRDLGLGAIHFLRFAPDGQTLACANESTGRIPLLRASDLEERSTFHHSLVSVESLAFSRDGRVLATGSHWSSKIVLWDMTKGFPLRVLEGRPARILSLAFSPDDSLLASGSRDGKVLVWDPTAGAVETFFEADGGTETETVWCVTFSPDGKRLASAQRDGSVRLWALRPRGHHRVIPVPRNGTEYAPVDWIAFSADGRALLAHTHMGRLERWDFDGSPAPTSLLHRAPRNAPPLNKGGSGGVGPAMKSLIAPAQARSGRIVTFDASSQLFRVRDPVAGLEFTCRPPILDLGHVAISADGKRVAFSTGTAPTVIWVWQVGSAQARELARLSDRCPCLAFAPDGETVAAADSTRIVLLDVAGRCPQRYLDGHRKQVYCVAYSPDGRLLAAGGWDMSVRIWEVATGYQRSCLWRHRLEVGAVAFSPDGNTLASGDGEVVLWNVAQGQQLIVLEGNPGRISGLAFGPDGKTLAAGGFGGDPKGEINIWYGQD
jgi:WD40 repeat protein/serine/threonine protein kinase